MKEYKTADSILNKHIEQGDIDNETIIKAMKEYATESIKLSLREASYNAEIVVKYNKGGELDTNILKSSIENIDNILLL